MATARKILKLDTLMIESAFFENAALLGLACDLPIYTLCHYLNNAFSLSFKRTEKYDVTIGKKKGAQTYTFAVYQSCALRSVYTYTLYKLKIEEAHLLPSIKNIDYLWLLRSEDVLEAEDLALKYLKALQSMPEIQFATLLETDKIKDIENLIL